MIEVEILRPIEIIDTLLMPGRYTAHISMGKFLYVHTERCPGGSGPVPESHYRIVTPLERLAEAAE